MSEGSRRTFPRPPAGWRVLLGMLVLASTLSPARGNSEVLRLVARVVDRLPHDPEAFTQGLLWSEGVLFESTGLYGSSSLRQLSTADGSVVRQRKLEDDLFAEGLARVDDRLVQLTWREEHAIVYDLANLEETARFSYEGEGWGLCFDGERLVMSDGSSRLTFRSPATFEMLETIEVTLSGRRVAYLNELECAEGWIYANVLGVDRIVRIDPATGDVAAVIEAGHLYPAEHRSSGAVLNGIAYAEDSETFYVTGKLWPELFQVVFVAPEP